MRSPYIAIFLICTASYATSVQAEGSNTGKSEYSTGRTQTPETKGDKQPQGWTGPIETGTGGRPPRATRPVSARDAARAGRFLEDYCRTRQIVWLRRSISVAAIWLADAVLYAEAPGANASVAVYSP